MYLESPDKSKGFYVALWSMSDEEARSPEELVQTFQETELESYFPKNEDWELESRSVDATALPVAGYWAGYSKSRAYRISGKQLAAGKFVLRATFHDYYATSQGSSAEFFAPIVDSLELHNT